MLFERLAFTGDGDGACFQRSFVAFGFIEVNHVFLKIIQLYQETNFLRMRIFEAIASFVKLTHHMFLLWYL